jgi:hypothetical protein
MPRNVLCRWQPSRSRPPRPAAARRRRARPRLEALEDRCLLTTWYVWQAGGSDQFGNGSITAPYQTIQQAVNHAAVSGDTVKVASGVYTYSPATDQVVASFGATGVVQVVNKFVTILGGFSDWSTPHGTPSVIDGQGLYRGVFLTALSFGGAALAMDGFTIQNCVGTSIPARGGAAAVNGYGGGMLSELSSTYLSNMVFQNDRAYGVNSSTGAGGVGAGGGLAAFSDPGTMSLTNVTFTMNKAIGGSGATAGGLGQGGGLAAFSDPGTVSLTNVTFTENVATGGSGATAGGLGQGGGLYADHCSVSATGVTLTLYNAALGGSSSGAGIAGGATADALGGGMDFENCLGGVTLSRVTARDCTAYGGNAPNGLAGGGFGGGLLAEDTNLTISDSNFRYDVARGGAGQNTSAARGSLASGGGIDLIDSNLTIDRSYLIADSANAGDGGPEKGSPTGGGLALSITAGNPENTLAMTNCVVADNGAAYGAGTGEPGGGGGGVSLYGGNATFTQDTFARNYLAGSAIGDLQGVAILADNPTGVAANVAVNYCILADNANNFSPPAAAIDVFPGNSAALNTNLFADNYQDTNAGGSPHSAGSFSGLSSDIAAASVGFLLGNTYGGDEEYQTAYEITPSSPAYRRAVGSTTPVDITGVARPNPPTLGAYEALVPTVQFSSSGYSFPENYGEGARITVTRTRDTSGSLTVGYTVSDGTAVAGTNYTAPTPGSLTFNPGETSKTFPITLLHHAPNRGTLTINLALTSLSGSPFAQFGATQTATVFIFSVRAQTVGVFEPVSAAWYLRLQNAAGPPTLMPFSYGGAFWRPIVGDWNGDGIATIGVVDPNNTFYLRNENSAGAPDAGVFSYGLPGWVPLAGNFLGNGRSGIAAFDSATGTWYVRGTATPGAPDLGVFPYGAPGWIPVVGDWTGTGHAGIGVVDPATDTWYLRSSVSPGAPDVGVFQYGGAGWIPVTGDWTGLGQTGIGVVDPATETWYLRNTASAGAPDFTPFPYGGAGWRPVAGSWIGVGGAPQLADSFEPFVADASAGITQAQLNATVTAALTRLQLDGIDAATRAQLASADYLVGDLPGTTIGFTSGRTVTIDRHAAGRGWFVDPTPLDDEEFDASGVALPGTAAQGKMDLLTVVLHEMGHLAGRGDQFAGDGDLMDTVLSTGHRRTQALDAVFGGASFSGA